MHRTSQFSHAGSMSWLQWVAIAAAGAGLGAYAILFSSLDTDWALLSLLAVIGLVAVVILGEIKRPILVAMLLDIPVPIDQFLNLRNNDISGGVQGYIVSLTTLCLIGLYAIWLAELIGKRRVAKDSGYRPQSLFWFVLPVVAFVAVNFLSLSAAGDREMAYFALFLLVQMLLVFIYIVGNVKTFDDLIFIMTWVLIGSAFHGLIMLGLVARGSSLDFGNVIHARIDGMRVGGTVGGPNSAAGYLELVVVPAISLVLLPVKRWYKVLAFASFSLSLIGVLLTQSRGGWVALAVSTTLFFLIGCYRKWIPISVLIWLGLIAIVIGVIFSGTIMTRITGDDNGAAAGRIPLMKIARNMIQENPVIGIGTNNFPTELRNYAKLDNTFLWPHVVHNKYLLVWSETGSLGIIAFLIFLISTLIRGWRIWLTQNPYVAPLALAITAAIIGHMFHLNFDIFVGRSLVQILWTMSALIVVLHRLAHTSNSIIEEETILT